MARIGCVLFFVAMCSVTFSQVIARYLMSSSIVWAPDVALACFVWMTFLGAGVAVNERSHFTVNVLDTFTDRYSWLHTVLSILEHCVVGLIGFMLLFTGYQFTEASMSKRSFAVGIDMGYFTAALPIAGAMIIIGTVHQVVAMVAGEEPATAADDPHGEGVQIG